MYRENWRDDMIHSYQTPLKGNKVGDWSMVAMYIVWTANCIYGWRNWSKLNKRQGDMY